jgi:hypothetical protein
LVGHSWARGGTAPFHFGWLTVTRSVATHCPPKNPHFCPDVYHMYTSETSMKTGKGITFNIEVVAYSCSRNSRIDRNFLAIVL